MESSSSSVSWSPMDHTLTLPSSIIICAFIYSRLSQCQSIDLCVLMIPPWHSLIAIVAVFFHLQCIILRIDGGGCGGYHGDPICHFCHIFSILFTCISILQWQWLQSPNFTMPTLFGWGGLLWRNTFLSDRGKHIHPLALYANKYPYIHYIITSFTRNVCDQWEWNQ